MCQAIKVARNRLLVLEVETIHFGRGDQFHHANRSRPMKRYDLGAWTCNSWPKNWCFAHTHVGSQWIFEAWVQSWAVRLANSFLSWIVSWWPRYLGWWSKVCRSTRPPWVQNPFGASLSLQNQELQRRLAAQEWFDTVSNCVTWPGNWTCQGCFMAVLTVWVCLQTGPPKRQSFPSRTSR